MNTVIQRVKNASVTINQQQTAAIGQGLMVLVGIEAADDEQDIAWLSQKIVNLRIFNDDAGVMNQCVLDVDGEILLVSQFTLQASTKKGNRPSYIKAARPDIAIPMYERLIQTLSQLLQKPVMTGQFGADMQVSLVNDGPVTILMDTKHKV